MEAHPRRGTAAPGDPPPPTARKAVIDIGTNSVKLLVADVAGRSVAPVFETGTQTRLGGGFYESRRLQPEAIARTAEAVATFAGIAKQRGASGIRAVATSAARDALNAHDLLQAIRESSALEVEVISGAQEADWAFQGVTTCPLLQDRPLLLLDVGGGSTEFILGEGATQHLRHSFPLGAVRLLECIRPADPPTASDTQACHDWLAAFLAAEVAPRFGPPLSGQSRSPIQLVGTGGTSAILARMELLLPEFDRARIEGARLTLPQIRLRRKHLWTLPLSARRDVTGLPPERADVILTGIAIFEAVMSYFALPDLWVTTRGLRFAALME
jgi:exopolyphosphatase/guanosine-5'-triphosphate,3'-diphosphate pyrophosphatase